MDKAMNTMDMKLTSQRAQGGVALPIVLIFLVVMLLLATTAVRNVTLGEKMAGNLRNQQLAFQAAERALRYCENAMQEGTAIPGLTPQTPVTAPAANPWEDLEGSWLTVSVAAPAIAGDGLKEPPRCMVEDVKNILRPDLTSPTVDPAVQAYRITAWGTGGTGKEVVLLQSYLRFTK